MRAPHCMVPTYILQVGKVTTEDEWVEPETHPLWEYPAYPRSEVHTLMNFDLTSHVPNTITRASGTMQLTSDSNSSSCQTERRCNAVVLWMDYQLSEQYRSTTGLVKVWPLQCTSLRDTCTTMLFNVMS